MSYIFDTFQISVMIQTYVIGQDLYMNELLQLTRNSMGRPKKKGGGKTSYWMSDINREMLKIYAERNEMDATTALNAILRQFLGSLGLAEEAKKRLPEQPAADSRTGKHSSD
jgi:hypothetical protein